MATPPFLQKSGEESPDSRKQGTERKFRLRHLLDIINGWAGVLSTEREKGQILN